MRKLLVYLQDYRRESVLAPLLKLAESLMDLLVPLVVAAIINEGIAQANQSLIWGRFALLIGLAALGMGFSFAAQWMAAKASVGCATKLRQALFDHIQGLSYRELDTLGTDTLITRMTSDINQIQNGLNLALRLLLRSPFIVFGAMICAFAIDVPSALLFAVAIPLLSLVVFGIMLASIVVRKDTGIPGDGYFVVADDLGREVKIDDPAERRRMWEREVTRVWDVMQAEEGYGM